MFDVAPTELLLVAAVALVVIGPKDLPKTLRVVGGWVGRARGVARQFRSGFDTMVREAELEEMEKRWAAENARIMKEHGAGAASGSTEADPAHDSTAASEPAPAGLSDDVAASEPEPSGSTDATAPHDPFGVEPDHSTDPVYVEKPHVAPAADSATSKPEGASS